MLSEITACFRLSLVGLLEEEGISEIVHDADVIELTTYRGRVFKFKKSDIEMIKHTFEDKDGNTTTYCDKLMSVFQEYEKLQPDEIDAVKIKGVPHRVFHHGNVVVVYNERKREVAFECKPEDLISILKSKDSEYKIYKITDGFL